MTLPKNATLSGLPPLYTEDLLPQITDAVRTSGRKLFVLDEDLTGTQTVYDIPLLTTWDVETLISELKKANVLTHILTNARNLHRKDAVARYREIVTNIQAAFKVVSRPFEILCRGDSALRGHFPAEINTLYAELAEKPDVVLVVPSSFEHGRYTLDDVQYITEKDQLVPAGQTEYARDAYFGYKESNLRKYILEKSRKEGVEVKPEDISSISLQDIREGGPEKVSAQLRRAHSGKYVIVNAADYRDLEVVALALTLAEKAEKRFMAWTAASFIRVRAGLPAQLRLTHIDFVRYIENFETGTETKAGLVLVGSPLQRATRQLETALALPGVAGIEIKIEDLLYADHRDLEISRVLKEMDRNLRAGRDAVVYTSRKPLTGSTPAQNLGINQAIASALAEMMQRLDVRPRWIIAKGQTTAFDGATKGLGMRRALVLGQVLPGISVWRTGRESRFPGLAYVVVPGRAGDDFAITQVITLLRGEQ